MHVMYGSAIVVAIPFQQVSVVVFQETRLDATRRRRFI